MRALSQASSCCGAEETRTPDFLLAKEALYQLSYGPWECRAASLLAEPANDGRERSDRDER